MKGTIETHTTMNGVCVIETRIEIQESDFSAVAELDSSEMALMDHLESLGPAKLSDVLSALQLMVKKLEEAGCT